MRTCFIITDDLPQPHRHTRVRTCFNYMGEPLLCVFYSVTPES